jgi:hypothetical protein
MNYDTTDLGSITSNDSRTTSHERGTCTAHRSKFRTNYFALDQESEGRGQQAPKHGRSRDRTDDRKF